MGFVYLLCMFVYRAIFIINKKKLNFIFPVKNIFLFTL